VDTVSQKIYNGLIF